ncbi:MAG: hypothetical protein LLG20_15160 [Acidobacteriales bacterium]|nr:hypothetical protein [Terriglobales bacterium]
MRFQWWWCLLAVPVTAVAQEEVREPPPPPVLSRGSGPDQLSSETRTSPMRFFAQVGGIYENGLTSLTMDENGEIPDDYSYGVEGEIGVLGTHRWKRTLVGLDYRGNYRHYTRRTYYDGSDHALTLGMSHQATRRTFFTLKEIAGTTSRNFGIGSPHGFIDPTYSQLPTEELFNGRTYYLNSLADVTYQKSARLSFNFGGGGGLTRRRSNALVGNEAEYARGDMMYRVSRHQTIGFDYAFTHYSFTRNYGSAFLHMGALDYAARLGRYWTFSLRGGATSVDTQGLIRVDIDPVIAAIIGRSYGIEIYQRQNLIPSGALTLTRDFRKAMLSFNYTDGATPGNGLYLTSRNRRAGADFSYSGIHRLNIGFNFDYGQYTSLSRDLDKYQGYGGGAGLAYQLARGLHAVARFDTRDYEIYGSKFARNTLRVTFGLAFSSGEGALGLW